MAEEEKPNTTPEPTLPAPPESQSKPDDPPSETPTPPAKFDPSRSNSPISLFLCNVKLISRAD